MSAITRSQSHSTEEVSDVIARLSQGLLLSAMWIYVLWQCSGSELKRTSEDVRTVALMGYERFVRLLEAHLTKMDKPHPRVLATAISSPLVGAVTLASIAPDKATAQQILKSAREYVLRDIG